MSRLYVLDNKDGTARMAQDIVDGLALLAMVRRVTATDITAEIG